MSKQFTIHYNITSEESFLILIKESGAEGEKAYKMTNNGGFQSFVYTGGGAFYYRYALQTPDGIVKERHLRYAPDGDNMLMHDSWRSPEMNSDLLRAQAFSSAVFETPKGLTSPPAPKGNSLTIRLSEARLNPDEAFCIVSRQFMNWSTERAFVMTRYDNSMWQYTIDDVTLCRDFEFKFGIWDTLHNTFKYYEEGANRKVANIRIDRKNVVTFDAFNYATSWKCAGVAVPIFSLRTSKSRGCGEFLDLKALADWCAETHLKVIQLLPINDTTATNTFKDSYPYNAISVMALHPNYINIDEVFAYYGSRVPSVERETGLFINDLTFVDYIRTKEWKMGNMRRLFASKFDQIMADMRFADYIEKNGWWVKDYAAFSVLRDKYGTPCFREWGKDSVYTPALVDEMFNSGSDSYRDVLFYVFVQYHLEVQLCEAIDYIHVKNIALKGDLPIGVNPNSVEAWVAPELYNFALQAGAPPDFFSRDGQNWGFPTYNWDVMAKDGFAWWGKRLGRMQQFFDTFRIDHILGFFRIWAIPHPFKSGLMGIFSPALPLTAEELVERGVKNEISMYTLPIITYDFLIRKVGKYADTVAEVMFDKVRDGVLRLKSDYFSPKAVEAWASTNIDPSNNSSFLASFDDILHEVLLVSVVDGEYHPRIMLTETERYRLLSDDERNSFNKIYDDFFFHRHNQFWKDMAIRNLEGMLKECDMLVCGEDLGMIPATVPVVMRRLQILALELQRMPKFSWERYGNCALYQYDSVCATSSHDISSIRGWWEENAAETQWYYNNVLGHKGDAPKVASGNIVAQVLDIHLKSPSMLCINPIQDYAGTIDDMPHLLPFEERINEPANANHYWRYRVPFKVDELVTKYPALRIMVRNLVAGSGRG